MQALIDSYPNSMLSVDRNYFYTAFNHNYAQTMLAAYGAHIEIGHNLLDYITSPKDRENAKQNLDRALKGENFIVSAYPVQSSGSTIFFDIHHIPIKDEHGDCVGVSVFTEEVTELIESRETLKDTEILYRNLYENINSVILITDPDSTSIVDANPAACSFYGYSHAELTKLHISDLAVLSPSEITEKVNQVKNRTSTYLNHSHRLANGEMREVDIFASPIQVNKKNTEYCNCKRYNYPQKSRG
ncbi:MAG: PAS domain-containing protein [Anaerolineales bacterium]